MNALVTTPVRVGVVFSFLVAASILSAQAPVDDLTRPAQRPAAAPAQPDPTLVLYNQLQQLRDEVLRLTSQVEELGYEVQRLQSAQASDYANLDARLVDMSRRLEATAGAAPAQPGSNQSLSQGQSAPANQQPDLGNGAATELYTESLDLLRSGNRQGAIEGFNRLVGDWPNDPLVADSYYWIGQTHWVAAEYEQAREAFAALVNGFAQHRKYGESLFRLGQVYQRLGNNAQARTYLQQAVETGSAISMQAEQLLSELD